MKTLLQYFCIGIIYIASIYSFGIAYAQPIKDTAVSEINQTNIRGVVSAHHQAILSAQLNAKISKTPVLTGGTFQKGDVLIQFDCDAYKAEAAARDAAYQAAKAKYDNTVEMKNFDAAGLFDVKIAKAEKNEAAAQARAIRARNKQCTIKAPYDGKVAQLIANAHETPGSDQPLIKIVGSEKLELRLIIPSQWLVWVKPGTSFTFTVDETGTSHSATIQAIGAEVDAVSRTVPIIAAFDDIPLTILPGMSGEAQFKQPTG